MKIVFTGGGTAGHIFPILAIVREMKQIAFGEKLDFFYIGPSQSYGLDLLKAEGVIIKAIVAGKVRRYFSLNNFFDLFKVPIGFFQALFYFFFLNPNVIVSKGGYGSFPASLAGFFLRVPVFLHESDSAPGLASRIESKWALEIFTSFSKTERFPKEKMILVGNPVRRNILGGTKQKAKSIFKLSGQKPLLLVLGGSQGSQSINNVIVDILPELLLHFELIHSTGHKHFKQTQAETNVLIQPVLKKQYHPVDFLNEESFKHALGAADLVVSRAGAGALFEIAAAGKPSLLIPMPRSAQDHQLKNAYQFADQGMAQVLEEANLKPHFFLERIKNLFSRPAQLKSMSENCLAFAKPKAAWLIASYLTEYLKQSSK